MIDLERELRATLEDRAHLAPLPVETRPAIRVARRRQLGMILTALAVVAAVVVGSVAGVSALIRSSERRIPVEPPDTFAPRGLDAAPIGSYAYRDLMVASDGAVWWTGPGITRFDPASGSLRTLTLADDPAFGDILLIAPARDGGVWTVETSSGERTIRRFDGERFHESLPSDPIAMAEGPDGTVWGESHGADLFRVDGGTWIPVSSKGLPPGRVARWWGTNTPDGLPIGGWAATLAVDAAGGVWMSYGGDSESKGLGVSRYDGTTWTTWTTSDGLPSDDVITIAPASNGDVWIGTSMEGVARFRNGSWTAYPGAVTGIWLVSSIAPTEEGVVVAGRSEFARFDGTTWSLVTAEDGLEGRGGRVAAGPSGVWAATGAGLFRLDGSRWERQVPGEGLVSGAGQRIAAVSSEEAWVAASPSVWHLEGGTWTEYPGIPEERVADIALAPDGVPWVSTTRGLARFDGLAWEQVESGEHDAIAFAPDGAWTASNEAWSVGPVGGPALPTLPNLASMGRERSLVLAVGPRDDVWVGWTEGWWGIDDAGLMHFEGGGWQAVAPYPGADRFHVTDLEATPDGDVWVSGSALDGCDRPGRCPTVARFRDGAWTTFREADGVPLPRGQLDVTPSGEVLLATSNGLFVFRDEAWHILQEGSFSSLSVAPDGTVWLSADDALFRLAGR